jgi:hypothetical protein
MINQERTPSFCLYPCSSTISKEQLGEQFPLSLYGQRGNGPVEKKEKTALFHVKRKRMAFGDKGQFQKLLVRILKRLGSEMDWNLFNIHGEILGQIRPNYQRVFGQNNLVFLLVRASGPRLSLAGRVCKLYAAKFDH